MNPNDFQTFPIPNSNLNELETNPHLPYNPLQSVSLIRMNPNDIHLQFFSIRSLYPTESETNVNSHFNPFSDSVW